MTAIDIAQLTLSLSWGDSVNPHALTPVKQHETEGAQSYFICNEGQILTIIDYLSTRFWLGYMI